MLLSALARHISGSTLIGRDIGFECVSIDTRTLQAGDLFVALVGENFNGHDFLQDSVRKKAVAIVIESGADVSQELIQSLPCLMVEDTRLALGSLGQLWSQQFPLEKVAITGSCGKTTVKELVGSILSQQALTLMTQGNFNNEIGVPLTLLNMRAEHRYAVLELGASGPGEIAYTSALVQPKVALVNNVAEAHLQGFGSLKGVARAKGEIYSGIVPGGFAVINLDDVFADYWIGLTTKLNRMSFTMYNTKKADVVLNLARYQPGKGSIMEVLTPIGPLEIKTSLLGEHHWANVLAAVSSVMPLGITAETIVQGVGCVEPAAGRLQVRTAWREGVTVIDDTYNANPRSMCAAIDVLAAYSGKRVLVLGDMAELGDVVLQAHQSIGEYARQRAIDELYVIGQFASDVVKGFGRGIVCKTHAELVDAIQQKKEGRLTVLVKGSRSAKMDVVVDGLVKK